MPGTKRQNIKKEQSNSKECKMKLIFNHQTGIDKMINSVNLKFSILSVV
jgi:hypothetical protein